MVQVCGESVECKVSAERMWHGLFKDAHNCLPKALPHHVRAVEYPHGQLGFHLLGHERLIKLHKGLGVHLVAALCEEAHEAEKFLKEEEALIKEEAENVDKELHKEEEVVKGKAEEVVGGVQKEAKEKVEEVGRLEKEAKEKVDEVGKEAAHAVEEEAHFAKKEVGGAAHEAAKVTEKVLHKEADVAHKAAHIVEKLLHKEGELVGATVHKVDAFLQHEELWIKEKIEEVHHEAFKITISVLAGGLIGVLFKHCKHTFELKNTSSSSGHGSILHWTSEFETLSSAVHYLHSFDKLKQHALAPFHSVESYLLQHDDYAH